MGLRPKKNEPQPPSLPLPVKITRVDPANLGTVHAQLFCKCDDGCDYVAKDGSQHPLIPHAEWLCTHLAALLNLPSLQCKVLELTEPSGNIRLLFGSRWEEGELPKSPNPWYSLVQQGTIPLPDIAPILSRIYAFDHFIYNIDRHLNNFFVKNSRNSFSILTMDYSKAWTYRGFPLGVLPFDLSDREHRTVLAQRALAKMWGTWLDCSETDKILNALKDVKADRIKEIIESHPKQWLPITKKSLYLNGGDQKKGSH